MALVITKLQRKAYEKAGWTKDEDIMLVRLLDKHACRKKLRGKERVYAVLEKCAARMTEELGRPILVSSLVRSLMFIWGRYKTFKSFIESPGVGYSIKFNRVYAREAYWQSLAGRNEEMSARNMRRIGEPLYPQLLNIFSYGCCFAPPSDAEDWGVGEEYSPGSGDESDAGDNKTGRSETEESGSN